MTVSEFHAYAAAGANIEGALRPVNRVAAIRRNRARWLVDDRRMSACHPLCAALSLGRSRS